MLKNSQITFISEIKTKVRNAQYEAMKAVNMALINLYWEIGKSIAKKQSESSANLSFLHFLKNYKMNFQELAVFLRLIFG